MPFRLGSLRDRFRRRRIENEASSSRPSSNGTASSASGKTRLGRWLVRGFVAASGMCALYLAVINVLLLSGGLAGLIHRGSASVVRVDAGTSYSLWPGHVRLRDVRVEVADSNVHLVVTATRGTLHVNLRALFDQRFSSSSITGSGFVVWLRPNVRDAKDARLEGLPPLEDAPKQFPPSPTEDLWGVELRSIDVALDELWVSSVHYQGRALLRGGAELQPRVSARIFPSELELRGGTLHRAGAALLSALNGTVRGSTPQVDIEGVLPRWARASAEVSLRARLEDAARLVGIFPRMAGVRGGAGQLSVEIELNEGQLTRDAEVSYRSDELRFSHRRFEMSGPVSLHVRAAAADETLNVRLELPSTLLRTQPSGATVEWRKASSTVRLTRDLPSPSVTFFAASASLEAVDARALSDLGILPSELRVVKGKLSGTFDAETRQGALVTRLQTTLGDLTLGTSSWRVHANGLALGTWTAKLHALTEGTLEDGLLDLHELDVVHGGGSVENWKARLRLPSLSVRTEPLAVTGDFDAFARDFLPALRLAGVELPQPLLHLIGDKSLHVFGRASVSADRQEIVIEGSKEPALDVRGRLLHRADGSYGAFLLGLSAVGVGAYLSPNHAGISLLADQKWLERELAALPR